ncbi:hypothetical protein LOTGIDRAFT_176628 [Lottia gigantea]|uniref:Uncharacterized protein n=1 Tax=Lottia gigantea TaxID=225164 RepID=V4C3T8_LOTGI|nr:hypothetical protein LOTGIDRAFT_176628 [Lottia gigantea]ESO96214.1 hypothetical protein LOTGIDRAFT_176628 [Lottia gigantea]
MPFIFCCSFLKRRKKKQQTDQNVTDQNVAGRHIYSNTIHTNSGDRNSHSDGYDHIPNNFIQTNRKKAVQVVMLSTENTDSLDNDGYSKYGEYTPEQLEHDPEQLELAPGQLESVPNTNEECADIQKKPQNDASTDKGMELNNSQNKKIVNDDYENLPKDKLNLTREIKRIVGPKGDDYTVVNKC